MVPLSPEKNEALNGFERKRSNRADKRKEMRDSERCCYAIEQHWKGNGGDLLLLLSNTACSKLFDEACSVRMSAYTLDQTKTYAYLSDMGTIKSSAAYPVDKPSDFAIQPKKIWERQKSIEASSCSHGRMLPRVRSNTNY